ncbi:type II toxin-antitoxin system RelE/ParE family toxin [Rubellimicrobium aerolatum]|uniref:Type II toxin-antitoxin system RelE/ParE family toxin n=1 Tax=Rubellimicrobium aerolatum TaxID=490979 RepID=A0ABW0SEI6_9RHOB|nr:toxin ParE1/3/4 [Rubellimicrobium aerolatum]
MKLELAKEADSDLLDILRYGRTHWGGARAMTYIGEIRTRMRSLAAGHSSGTQADEIAPGLRRQVAASHVIWFRVEGDRLRVLRVLHGNQDAPHHLT